MKYLILAIALLAIFVFPAGASDWQNETVDSAGNVGSHTSLAFDSSGNPAISYYDYSNYDLKYASYNGESWQATTVDSAEDVGRYSSLAFDGSENPAISYYDYGNYDLKYSSYNGESWQATTVDSAGAVGHYTSLAFDGSGNPAISYYDNSNYDLKYASYNGESWQTITVDSAGTVGWYTSLAFDGSGNPAISYYDASNDYLKYASYNGESWQATTVDSTGDVGRYSSLAFDGSGNPTISYYDASNYDLKYASYNGESWQTITVDSTGIVGRYSSLAFDGSGNPAISYADGSNADLKYASYNGESWQTTTVDSAGDIGSYTSLAFDGSGNPAISYWDVSNVDLKYASISQAGILPVNSSVIGAWVYVNGTNQSVQANTTLSLQPGYYDITTIKQYYGTPANQTVNVTTGTNSGIEFTLIPSLPVAGFTSNVTSGEVALSVAFTDQSVGVVSSWLWNFGDGNTSTEQDPTHTYESAGTYTVSLNATNSAGSNISTHSSYITVVDVPVADFAADVRSGSAPLSVSFTDLSANDPTSWLWDFGDGINSTDQNPTHSYTSAGTYNVTLNATNSLGSNVSTQTGYITVTFASSECSSSSGTRVSVGPSLEPENVSVSDTSVRHVLRGASVEFDLSGGDDPVVAVTFDAKDNEGLVVTKVQVLNERPTDVPFPQRSSYSLMSIDVGAEGTISEDNSDNLRISFKVSKGWIEQNNIDVSTIRMSRYNGGQWNDLPTYQQREDDEYIYFYADTPGFSIFEVVGDEITKVNEQVPASSFVTEEKAESVNEEESGILGFIILAGIVIVSIAFLVSKKQK